MTRFEFDLFTIAANDFKRNIRFFHNQCVDDKYQQEMLEDLINAVNQSIILIDEATEGTD
jgi:hypothetical protein